MEYNITKQEEILSIKQVQTRLFDMAKEISSILEENDIPYMITFGTLLGAVRHKGFIPWDDDFDFFLFSDTYKKAINILRKELPPNLFLEDEESEPLYFHGWAHVKDLNSEVVCTEYPQDGIYEHKGLSVDLYIAKEMEEKDLDFYVIDQHIAYLNRKYLRNLIDKYVYKQKICELEKKRNQISIINSTKKIFALNVPEKSMDYLDVMPLKRIVFDGHSFWGPANPDRVLAQFYGDYMNLPSKEKQIPHYTSVLFK